MNLTREPTYLDYSRVVDYLVAMGDSTVKEIATALLRPDDQWVRERLIAAEVDGHVGRRAKLTGQAAFVWYLTRA
ncbi:hypothetical protein LCGC14_0587800 [marine sediment metagenome]|uniref:Uncharacterized protein n=1 Tax=marine sediment metagenome TaxID=412755 RepID=A0A0F9RY94_9ZZZZ